MGYLRGGKKRRVCSRRNASKKDNISELPDDILLVILSHLPIKEAGRTSVLSKRYRDVWPHIQTLNFDPFKLICEIVMCQKSLVEETPRYVSLVDHVVGSLKAPAIDEFKVMFNLDYKSRGTIDNWVRFATEKKVKSLHLDFLKPHTQYCFPKTPLCSSLISLELSGISIDGKTLKEILANCQSLETLAVKNSCSLKELSVFDPLPNLKYLTLKPEVCGLKLLEICAPNLIRFSYSGDQVKLPFETIPKNVELSLGGHCATNIVDHNFMKHSSSLSQIEVLMLDLRKIHCSVKQCQLPQLTRLKKLEVKVYASRSIHLCRLHSLLYSCPLLETFVVQMYVGQGFDSRKKMAAPNPANVRCDRHYHLKTLKIVGFFGHATDMEFAMYLIGIAVRLKKIIIDTRKPLAASLGPSRWVGSVNDVRQMTRAREKAQKLGAKLKRGAKLEII